ncbi:hypothetical protein K402DRAFT_334848 [Aulographum hederae CBS 113979]|uniref:Nudix hydrolase domain-containing protein n=1 Tax=Aulographum hederae CBS 113979 TaxID=1176131 RepID=A0A6G1GX02_9PEZI|nr:hypothetical protein K402DRAFT_334848 [Aulographum hederae CBS 113979]
MLPANVFAPPERPPTRPRDPTQAPPSLTSTPPTFGRWDAQHFVDGAGVAIFHVKSARVVLCWHSRHRYWFLPKGRRDAGEAAWRGACREGFEESGYRNRMLPLPIQHKQPAAHNPAPSEGESGKRPDFVIEPVWSQMIPLKKDVQYLFQWYIAETLPPDEEKALGLPEPVVPGSSAPQKPYFEPNIYPSGLTLRQRMAMEPVGYEPPRHEGTGVDPSEMWYTSALIPVDQIGEKLGQGVEAEVAKAGWRAILKRVEMEQAAERSDRVLQLAFEMSRNRAREEQERDGEGSGEQQQGPWI